MKPWNSLLAVGESLLDRVLCVTGALAFTQLPEFFQQYLQRLGGHLDEARRQLLQFQNVATQSGLTVEALARQTSQNADTTVAKLGGLITAAIERVRALELAQSALEHASLWTRPIVFFQHVDPSIARATWSVFRPAVPTTAEGFIYGAIGMIVLLGLYHGGIKYPVTCWRNRTRLKKQIVQV